MSTVQLGPKEQKHRRRRVGRRRGASSWELSYRDDVTLGIFFTCGAVFVNILLVLIWIKTFVANNNPAHLKGSFSLIFSLLLLLFFIIGHAKTLLVIKTCFVYRGFRIESFTRHDKIFFIDNAIREIQLSTGIKRFKAWISKSEKVNLYFLT